MEMSAINQTIRILEKVEKEQKNYSDEQCRNDLRILVKEYLITMKALKKLIKKANKKGIV